MLKLMIVDDEKVTREGIRNCINWGEYDIEIVGVARNGLEALEIIKGVKPDLLITDVKMPLMDGIELANILRHQLPKIKIIFISGYSEIDYLKSAFKVNVEDYILKPVDIGEMEEVIKRVSNLCKEEQEMNSHRIQLELKLKQSLPYLKENFMKLLINGEAKEKEDIIENFTFLGVDIPIDAYFSVFIISIDEYRSKYIEMPMFERQLLFFSILNVVQETIDKHTKGTVFKSQDDEFVCLISLPKEKNLIEECIDMLSKEIHENLNKFLKLSITLGVGLWVESIEKIYFSYKHASYSVSQKLYNGKNKIIYIDKLTAEKGSSYLISMKTLEELQIALHSGNYEKTQLITEEIFSNVRKSEILNIKYVQAIWMQVFSIITLVTSELNVESINDEIRIDKYIIDIFKLETLNEMYDLILKVCKSLCDSIKLIRKSDKVNVAVDIKNIILKDYSKDISIDSIAREVFLTPAYICMLFKQETGITINNYMTNVRMGKAKQLLLTGKYKQYEIASMLGYTDHKYFSKLFKKHTGISPSEYSKEI